MDTITIEQLAQFDATDGPVVVFTFGEMTHLEFMGQLLAARAKVDHGLMESGRLTEIEWPKINGAIRSLQDLDLWIDDKPNPDVAKTQGKVQYETSEPVNCFRLEAAK